MKVLLLCCLSLVLPSTFLIGVTIHIPHWCYHPHSSVQRCNKRGIEHDAPIHRYYERLATVQARGSQASHQVVRDILKEAQTNMVPRGLLKEWAVNTFLSATDYWTFRKTVSCSSLPHHFVGRYYWCHGFFYSWLASCVYRILYSSHHRKLQDIIYVMFCRLASYRNYIVNSHTKAITNKQTKINCHSVKKYTVGIQKICMCITAST